MSKFKVTSIQFFPRKTPVQTNDEGDYEYIIGYGANIAINDEFMIQCDGNGDEINYSIPASDSAQWSAAKDQDYAFENYDLDEIVAEIEAAGFENNYHYLEEHADLTM